MAVMATIQVSAAQQWCNAIRETLWGYLDRCLKKAFLQMHQFILEQNGTIEWSLTSDPWKQKRTIETYLRSLETERDHRGVTHLRSLDISPRRRGVCTECWNIAPSGPRAESKRQ